MLRRPDVLVKLASPRDRRLVEVQGQNPTAAGAMFTKYRFDIGLDRAPSTALVTVVISRYHRGVAMGGMACFKEACIALHPEGTLSQ
jgi:hypothetical protein